MWLAKYDVMLKGGIRWPLQPAYPRGFAAL